jgi:hypothetical protein
MFFASRAWAVWSTLAWSVVVSGCPSERFTTTMAVDVVCCGNAFLARSIACTDSYSGGRKLPWSDDVMSASDGAVAMIAMATASQPPMTHQARRTTNSPSEPNMKAP